MKKSKTEYLYIRDLFILSILAPWIQKALKRWPIIILVIAVAAWLSPFNSYFRQTFTFFLLGGLVATNKQIKDTIITRRNTKLSFFSFILSIATSIIDVELFRD